MRPILNLLFLSSALGVMKAVQEVWCMRTENHPPGVVQRTRASNNGSSAHIAYRDTTLLSFWFEWLLKRLKKDRATTLPMAACHTFPKLVSAADTTDMDVK